MPRAGQNRTAQDFIALLNSTQFMNNFFWHLPFNIFGPELTMVTELKESETVGYEGYGSLKTLSTRRSPGGQQHGW